MQAGFRAAEELPLDEEPSQRVQSPRRDTITIKGWQSWHRWGATQDTQEMVKHLGHTKFRCASQPQTGVWVKDIYELSASIH